MQLCYKCKHFEIRYSDKLHKYGCRALGFKSPTADWHWLEMPCPAFIENPARLNRASSKSDDMQSAAHDDEHKINLLI